MQTASKSAAHFAREGFFGPLGQILLEHGQEFKRDDTRLPERWQGTTRPKRQCFRNCAELALGHPGELVYVEGYAFADIPLHFPIAHAWLQTSDGQLLDPTWQGGSGYWGIEMPKIGDYLLASEQYGVLESLWMSPRLRELFREDFPLEEEYNLTSQ